MKKITASSTKKEMFDNGLKTRKAVLGDAYVDRSFAVQD